MKLAKVIGTVVCTVKDPSLDGQKILLIEPEMKFCIEPLSDHLILTTFRQKHEISYGPTRTVVPYVRVARPGELEKSTITSYFGELVCNMPKQVYRFSRFH